MGDHIPSYKIYMDGGSDEPAGPIGQNVSDIDIVSLVTVSLVTYCRLLWESLWGQVAQDTRVDLRRASQLDSCSF